MTTSEMTEAVEQSSVWRLIRSAAPTVLAAALIGLASLLWSEREARVRIEHQLYNIDERITSAIIERERDRARLDALEARQTAVELITARQEEKLIAIVTSLERVEKLIERVYGTINGNGRGAKSSE